VQRLKQESQHAARMANLEYHSTSFPESTEWMRDCDMPVG